MDFPKILRLHTLYGRHAIICIIFYLCLFRCELMRVSFGHYY